VLGLGIGLVMQVLILVVQNSAPRQDMGSATAAANYFRQIGASLGASIVGAIFTHRLTDKLATLVPRGAHVRIPDANSITPALLKRLPPTIRAGFIKAYADSLTPVFLYLVPLVALAFVLAWFLKEIPLRSAQSMAVTANGNGLLPPDRRDALLAGLVLSLAAHRATRHDRPGSALTRALANMVNGHDGEDVHIRARRAADDVVRPAAIALLRHAAGDNGIPPLHETNAVQSNGTTITAPTAPTTQSRERMYE
jgi:hypothetical protein